MFPRRRNGGHAEPRGYRECADITLFCGDGDGFRAIRTAPAGKPYVNGILRAGATIETLRPVKANQLCLQTIVRSQSVRISLNVVREARMDLAGAINPWLGLPILSRDVLYVERLLANADRWNVADAFSRDIFDLSIMISSWGDIPDVAWQIAAAAYGPKVRDDFVSAVGRIRDTRWMEACAKEMGMDHAMIEEILAVHGGAS